MNERERLKQEIRTCEDALRRLKDVKPRGFDSEENLRYAAGYERERLFAARRKLAALGATA